LSESPYDYIYIESLAGGVNKNDSPLEIRDDQMQLCLNGILRKRGAVKKRAGYAKEISRSIADDVAGVIGIDNVTRYYYGANSIYVVAALTAAETKIVYWDGTNWIELTGGTVFDNGSAVQFLQYRENLLMYNGNQFEYTDVTLMATDNKDDCGFTGGTGYISVDPKVMEVCDDRLFAVDNTNNNTLYYSEVDGYTTNPGTDLNFKTNDNLPIPWQTADGAGINGLKRDGITDELLIGRDSDLAVLLGVDASDYRLMQIHGVAGFVSPRGMIETEDGDLIFVGNNQIWEKSGGRITPIGTPEKPEFDGVNMDNATCIYDAVNACVIIGHRNGTLVWNVVRDIDQPPLRSWTEWDIPFTCGLRLPANSDSNKIVFGFRDSPYLWEMNSGKSDNGENILFRLQTKTIDLSRFAEKKKVHSTKVLTTADIAQPYDVTIVLNDGVKFDAQKVNVQLVGMTWDEDDWDDALWAGEGLVQGTALHGADLIKFNEFSVVVESDDQNDLTVFKIAVEGKFEPRVRDEPE